MAWRPKDDIFTFHFDEERILKPAFTPRDFLAISHQLYDPLGFIAPFQLIGRRLLQRATSLRTGWDIPVDELLRGEFQEWANTIPNLSTLQIPRWWNSSDCGKIVEESLHAFADASLTGYGAAIYRRAVDELGRIFVTLLAARSHVVPLNPARASHHNSIPRLELAACLKAVELRLFVEAALGRKFKVFFMTDSECSLKFIYDPKTPHKAYFANRLSKIHAGSSPNEWSYVDTKSYPADHVSRGIRAHEKEKWDHFHRGPDFLWNDESTWPKNTVPRDPKRSRIEDFVSVAAAAVETPPQQPPSLILDIVSRVDS